jgi:SAM-dependent methyltransferase
MFDLVTAFETYYFWPDLINDLKEIMRIMKPGGSLLMANEAYTHAKFEKRNSRWAELADMALHTPEEYRDFFTEAGYTNVEISVVPEKNWIAAVAEK